MICHNLKLIVILVAALALSGCGSSKNRDSASEVAVTGEFHEIQPVDVEEYIAIFEGQQSRLGFTIDGVEQSLTFEEIDAEDNWLIASYENHLLFIGFNLEDEEPLPNMILLELSGEEIVNQQSSGSVNDAINVHTGRLVREASLATHVPSDGDINSGAVDLFTAGVIRTVEAGGNLGVHSWCCEDGVTADNLSISDPAHGTQLTYFREMLPDTGEDFYFFTLQAASFDDIHPMSLEEMTRFRIVTE